MGKFFEAPEENFIRKKFEKRLPLYQQLLVEIEFVLKRSISSLNLKVDGPISRIKSFESFYGKICRKEIENNYFEKITDIVGVRLICLYRSELKKIGKIINSKFNVIEAQTSGTRSKMDFGYMSDHYVVTLPKSCQGERYNAIKHLTCEIQVRTVSMHAWATVSHQLEYKQEIDIPTELKDDFKALSGVFYIADSLFDQIRKAREMAMKKLMDKVSRNEFNFRTEINLDTLKAYLSWKFSKRKLFREEQSFSLLLSRIKNVGISNYQELDEILNVNLDWLMEKERTGEKSFTTAVGAANTILRERLLENTRAHVNQELQKILATGEELLGHSLTKKEIEELIKAMTRKQG